MRAFTVRDDADCYKTIAHETVWARLAQQGYAVTSDKAIGLPESFREQFGEAYFNPETLRNDEGDWPIDRQRARDVVHYRWHSDALRPESYHTIAITDRAQLPGKRIH